jgi:hypothetical protein
MSAINQNRHLNCIAVAQRHRTGYRLAMTFLYILVFIASTAQSIAQPSSESLEEQLKSLAKRNARQDEVYSALLSTLDLMDSTAQCNTLAALRASVPQRNYRYHLWLTILYNHLEPGL